MPTDILATQPRQSLARLGARTLGIDASEQNINIARHHAGMDYKLRDTLSYQHTAAETLLAARKQYDVVCSMEVIEHVDNPPLFLETLMSLVKVRLPIFI